MTRTFRHAVVIGASSGIGEAIARRLAVDGSRVALVARRRDRLEVIAAEIDAAVGESRALVVEHDVRDHETPAELVQYIARELGGLDLAVYAAGVMHEVAPDEYDTAKDLDMLDVNLGGAIAWLNPIADRFARLGRGTIVGIGSVAGDRGRVGAPAYNTSKSGLATYLEALRNRIHRTGARVVTIKPGFVDTSMTAGKTGLLWLISADRAAEIILSKARRISGTAYVPARWRVLMGVIRRIPSWLFRRLRV